MSQVKMGITEDGFARIAEAAARQRSREAATEEALQPAALRYASLAEVEQDFEPTPESGLVMDRRAHRVWQMKAMPGGGFELIRAQDESIDDESEDEEKPEGIPVSARMMKAASRGAVHLGQTPAEMPAPPMTAQGGECACAGACQCGCGCAEAGSCVCAPGCGCPCGCGETTAQAAPAAPPAAMPPPSATPDPMVASLKDIAETPEDRRTAGLKRGASVMVRIGRRDVLKGKVLARNATHFDVLLENGATTRVLHQDVAPDSPRPKAAIAQPTAPVTRKAVDEKAKEYWESYFKEYGKQLVKSDLPRAITDHAEPATPAGKQKTPTKTVASLAVGDVVDIGNIWMAGKSLRTGVVKVIKAGKDRLAVQDPFGGKMVVPRKAVVAVRDPSSFTTTGKMRPNRARILQAAAAALTWEQIESRYPEAVQKIRLARKWVVVGVRIAQVGGAVPTKSSAGVFGKAAAVAAWQPKLRKKALDEVGKNYYKAYWGDYGEDLVKEVKRRVKADVIERAVGRQVENQKSVPQAPRSVVAAPQPKPQAVKPLSLHASLANALTSHVAGVMKKEGAVGRYSVDPRSVEVSSSSREGNRRVLAGRFVGRYVAPDKRVMTRQSFELLVEGGKVKAVKISKS